MSKTINEMAEVSPFLWVTALKVNGLNSSIKSQRLAEWKNDATKCGL